MNNKVTKHLGWIIPLAVFALCLTLSVMTYGKYGQYNLDSDMSSDLVLAQLLNDEGQILTTNFYYSNELNIVSPIIIYQLALKLFNSWHIARTFSIAVLLIILAASLLYLGKGAGISVGTSLLCAAAIVLPLTGYQAFTLVYGGFYTVWAALTFFEIGLLLRMKKKRIIEPILLAVTGLLGGLSGVRMLMICAAPMAAACLINFFLEASRVHNLKEMVSLPAFRTLIGGIICAAATYAGYWICTNVFSTIYHFEQFEDTTFLKLQPDMLQDQIMALMEYFGYRADSVILSNEGYFSLFAFILPILGFASIIILLRMNLDSEERLFALFMQIAIILGIVINVLTLYDVSDSPYPYAVSYYIPAALLLVYAIFWMLDRFECKLRILRMIPMLIGVVFFILGFTIYEDNDIYKYEDEKYEIAQILLDEDVKQGYATYWYANVLTELTDGQIEVYMVEDWYSGRIGKWLQRADHTETEPEGRIFAIFSMNDYENEVPGIDMDHLIYSSDKVFICVYDDVEEFNEYRYGT